MKNLTLGTSYTEPFAVNSTPDATPSAAVYAGSTLLGAASIAADTGANAYIATVTLPSTGLTDGTLVRVKVSWSVGGVAYNGWLDIGVANLYAVQAAAVLAAATSTPIRADMRLINGEPPQPLGYDPARQETVEEVLGAVEAAKDYPEASDVRDGVEYANGLYVGVLDVGTGLPTPEYPPGSAGL